MSLYTASHVSDSNLLCYLLKIDIYKQVSCCMTNVEVSSEMSSIMLSTEDEILKHNNCIMQSPTFDRITFCGSI